MNFMIKKCPVNIIMNAIDSKSLATTSWFVCDARRPAPSSKSGLVTLISRRQVLTLAAGTFVR